LNPTIRTKPLTEIALAAMLLMGVASGAYSQTAGAGQATGSTQGSTQEAKQAEAQEAIVFGQSIADAMREATNADFAFIAAGQLRPNAQRTKLEMGLMYPNEELAVLKLKGKQIRDAFERSFSFYPQTNVGFLYFSGCQVGINEGELPGSRIRSVVPDAGLFDNEATYTVAMPTSLAKGALGYFKVWDGSTAPTPRSEPKTLLQIATGKSVITTAARWFSKV